MGVQQAAVVSSDFGVQHAVADASVAQHSVVILSDFGGQHEVLFLVGSYMGLIYLIIDNNEVNIKQY